MGIVIAKIVLAIVAFIFGLTCAILSEVHENKKQGSSTANSFRLFAIVAILIFVGALFSLFI